MKTIVIGAGASGLVAAIYAAKGQGKVLLLERNPMCGKKILITGNGKCNYFNEDMSISNYYTENKDILEKIITKQNIKEILSFFDTLGIVPKIKNGYYYPYSNLAVTVREALELEAKMLKVEIKNNFYVEEVTQRGAQFVINPQKENLIADNLVLATGSKSFPKTGSDGVGYDFVKGLGHHVNKPLPALVPLKLETSYLKEWAGIRCDAKVSLFINKNMVAKEEGEIQLTNYGISGICIFNISHFVSKALEKGQDISLTINFLPFLPSAEIVSYLEDRNKKVKERTLEQLLEPLVHYKLVRIILKECHLPLAKHFEECTEKEKQKLGNCLSTFPLKVIGTESFDKAQVCVGGVPMDEVNPSTLESLRTKNLYIIGELLDVNGKCGGYNLSHAWITGMLAGKKIGEIK
ncbi:MAG: aminoacetone oxidase family FAD-binding enzyme [Bacilli bacterium]|nr:aminoacetone oxidase family FAD-binding enzyme [Bacilli bacterium]